MIYGIGVNDLSTPVSYMESGKQKYIPEYTLWRNMLNRCYGKDYNSKFNAYGGVTVCEEWKRFSNFKKFYDQQHFEGSDLDKDLTILGNKIYSPETCAFIPVKLNRALAWNSVEDNLAGVTWDKKREVFSSRVYLNGKRKFLGYYESAKKAHKAWQLAKAEHLEKILLDWRSEPSYIEAVATNVALIIRKLREDADQGIETKNFWEV